MLKIRRVSEADIDALIPLIEAHAEFERASLDVAGLAVRLEQAITAEVPRLRIFVADVKSQLLGFCSLTIDFSTWRGKEFLHLDCLFVSPSARRMRVATRLFEKAEQYASECGLDEMQWQSPDWNHAAQRFYESQGATSTAKRRYCYSL